MTLNTQKRLPKTHIKYFVLGQLRTSKIGRGVSDRQDRSFGRVFSYTIRAGGQTHDFQTISVS